MWVICMDQKKLTILTGKWCTGEHFAILVNYSLLNFAYRWTSWNFVAGHSTRRQMAKWFLLKLREAVLGYISQNMSRPQWTKIHGVYETIWNLNHEALLTLPGVCDIITKCYSVSVNTFFLFSHYLPKRIGTGKAMILWVTGNEWVPADSLRYSSLKSLGRL